MFEFDRFDVAEWVKQREYLIEEKGIWCPDFLMTVDRDDWTRLSETEEGEKRGRGRFSAFLMVAFYLNLSDEESAQNLYKYLSEISNEELDSTPYLLAHSSGEDLEARISEALDKVGIDPAFVL